MCYNKLGDEMKKDIKEIYIFAVIFFVVDQIIKIFLSSKMIVNQSFILIKNFLSITLVHNKGAAFSILTGSRFLLIIIALLVLAVLVIYIKKQDVIDYIDAFAYSLLIGGTLGNLMDRIVHGYVIDYISLGFGEFYFPIFNFADICIVGAVIIMLIKMVKESLWK